jgi:hypothetical protein
VNSLSKVTSGVNKIDWETRWTQLNKPIYGIPKRPKPNGGQPDGSRAKAKYGTGMTNEDRRD